MNTQLNDMVLLDMWNIVYPDIDLDEQECKDITDALRSAIYVFGAPQEHQNSLHCLPIASTSLSGCFPMPPARFSGTLSHFVSTLPTGHLAVVPHFSVPFYSSWASLVTI